MRRPFGCHYRVHVRHSVHLPAQERITVLYPSPAGQLDDSADRQGSQIVRARGALWLILLISAGATFLSIAVSS
jgi:hypothetical protein